MKITRNKFTPILVKSLITLVTMNIWSLSMTSKMVDRSNKIMNTQKKRQHTYKPKDKCWIIKLEGMSIPYEVIKEIADRELKGYPKEIPLNEAIRIFNEEKQCASVFASYPPLTEDELISSIIAGGGSNLRGGQGKLQEDILCVANHLKT